MPKSQRVIEILEADDEEVGMSVLGGRAHGLDGTGGGMVDESKAHVLDGTGAGELIEDTSKAKKGMSSKALGERQAKQNGGKGKQGGKGKEKPARRQGSKGGS